MSAGMVIEVRPESARREPASVEVFDSGDLHARYERLLGLVLRMGGWLSGPQARLLPNTYWEAQFSRYQEHLEDLRRLGDELRPVSLRNRHEPLSGDALVGEVAELFAA